MERTAGSARGPLLVLAYGVSFSLMAAVFFVWLHWKCVPMYAGMFEAMGMALPNSTRLVILVSQWTGRLLPLFVLAFLLAAPGTAVLAGLAARRYGAAKIAWIAASVSLASAMLLTAAAGVTVFALQQPLRHAVAAAEERRSLPPARPTP